LSAERIDECALADRVLIGTRRECAKGRYRSDRLIEKYGIDAKLFDWPDDITADCPRKQAERRGGGDRSDGAPVAHE